MTEPEKKKATLVGRRPYLVPRAKKHITLNQEVLAEVEEILLDPFTGRLHHGSLSGLVNSLLKNWLEQQRRSTPRQDTHE